jgi:hypothetical protein
MQSSNRTSLKRETRGMRQSINVLYITIFVTQNYELSGFQTLHIYHVLHVLTVSEHRDVKLIIKQGVD